MNKDTELFELCREVHKRIDWDSEELSHYQERIGGDGQIMLDVMSYEPGICPLYTSDYILEKLPRLKKVKDHVYHLIVINGNRDEDCWVADYYSLGSGLREEWYAVRFTQPKETEADTPLKALLKLTIALHEAGELS